MPADPRHHLADEDRCPPLVQLTHGVDTSARPTNHLNLCAIHLTGTDDADVL